VGASRPGLGSLGSWRVFVLEKNKERERENTIYTKKFLGTLRKRERESAKRRGTTKEESTPREETREYQKLLRKEGKEEKLD